MTRPEAPWSGQLPDVTITPDMMQLIREQRLGFVATVNADGTPNLSPKGTFVVVDGTTVAFGEIRSPNTRRNFAANPAVEINFVDPFTRRGCRLFGMANVVQQGEPNHPLVRQSRRSRGAHRSDRLDRRGPSAAAVLPAYDNGVSEEELQQTWTNRFRTLQPEGRFMNSPP